ncbi:hypothetical protein [Paraburkholderia sp. CI3]|uniref:hypothetical protein n=1 Tax=Paraburkholderia sp. CI3 TaxID=2991060 RepID=UPI003D261D17
MKNYEVAGHNDGLKVNPYTREIRAMQNEDANPNLVIINPRPGQASAPINVTCVNRYMLLPQNTNEA